MKNQQRQHSKKKQDSGRSSARRVPVAEDTTSHAQKRAYSYSSGELTYQWLGFDWTVPLKAEDNDATMSYLKREKKTSQNEHGDTNTVLEGDAPYSLIRERRSIMPVFISALFGTNAGLGGASGFLGVNAVLNAAPIAGQFASAALCLLAAGAYCVKMAADHQRTINHELYKPEGESAPDPVEGALNKVNDLKENNFRSFIDTVKSNYKQHSHSFGLFQSRSSHAVSSVLALEGDKLNLTDAKAILKDYLEHPKNQGKALFTAIVLAAKSFDPSRQAESAAGDDGQDIIRRASDSTVTF